MRSEARWTEAQRRAIEERDRDILVSAAAGSGKTSVLVRRVIERLLDPRDPLTLDRVLVVTFTESAAAEMKERIRAALLAAEGEQSHEAARHVALLESAAISTLHGFCLQLLRRSFHAVGLDPAFRVLDPEEAEVLKERSLDEVFEASHASSEERESRLEPLLDHYGGPRDDQELRGIVLALYEFIQSLPDGDAWLDRALSAFEGESGAASESLALWQDVLFEEARRDVEQAAALLDQGARLARLPAGPGEYEPFFLEEKEKLGLLLEPLRERDWNEAWSRFQGVRWRRRPAVKECDPSLKEEAGRLWDEAKKKVNRWASGPFGRKLEAYAEEIASLKPVTAALVELVRAFAARYESAKRRAAAVDFSDLERLALRALEQPEVAAVYRSRFEEVVVDEYQDINPVQDRLIELLSRAPEGRGNRFMVGDIKQSIYGFRLADPRIFHEKSEAFKASAPGGPCRIDLQANFRSHPQILEVVNFLFRQIMHRGTQEIEYGPDAWLKPGIAAAQAGECDPERVQLHLIEREELEGEETGLRAVEREALLVGRLIRELVASGRSYREIAVLFRSPKGRVDHFVQLLGEMGIPAYSRGGTGFFRAVEVETILALLRLVDNARQEIPLAAVLRSPIVGLSSAELARIRAAHKERPFIDAVYRRAEEEDELGAKLRSFLGALREWRKAARRMPFSRFLWRLYRETGYLDFAAAMPGGRQREANLFGLYQRARYFDAYATQGLHRFLDHVDALQEAGEEAAPPPVLGEGEEVVQLLSVHQSKGLEFPIVILCDLDRKWNRTDSRRPLVFHRDLGIGPAVLDRERHVRYPSLAHWAVVRRLDQESLAEEMRLLYVAATRAKERLILVGSARDLERRCASWAEASRCEGWALPAGSVLSAASWLDWIGSAFARHASGEPLRVLGAGDLGAAFYGPNDPEVARAPISFSVRFWRGSELVDACAPLEDRPVPAVPEGGAAVEKARRREADPEVIQAVERLYGWKYRREALTAIPAKVSVTEASKLLFSARDEEATPLETIGAKPALNAARSGRSGEISPAERGTAIHLLLARLELKPPPTGESLRKRLGELIDRRLIRPEVEAAIDLDALLRFFASPLGERLLRAAGGEGRGWWVRRELTFTMALPAAAVYTGFPFDDAAVHSADTVVQGSIDCLVKDDRGLLLIDFKTDRVPPGGEGRAAGLYERQVELYARFLRTLEPEAPLEAYLFFLETGRAHPVAV